MPEPRLQNSQEAAWLGLVVGNTRLHWGLFHQQRLAGVWHTPHLTPAQAELLIGQGFAPGAWRSLAANLPWALDLPATLAAIATPSEPPLPLVCASVVPGQTALWQTYPGCHAIQLAEVPLHNLYPTLGIDRALNLLGASDRYGWPVLVIDAGTALTLTAGTAGRLVGGAILPGLTTQFTSLAQTTAALPNADFPPSLPSRWATNTPDAIRSGILYGTLATLEDFAQAWQQDYPRGQVVLTGGDGARLYHWWRQRQPKVSLAMEPDLTLWGLAHWRQRHAATDREF